VTTEGVHLADDGSVTVVMGKWEWRLRTPTIGEWRKLRELADAADASLGETGATVAALGDSPLYAEFLREAINLLGDGPPPSVEDMSMWAVTPTATAELITHWTFVPLVRGDRNASLPG
jgi:hypothetical protein